MVVRGWSSIPITERSSGDFVDAEVRDASSGPPMPTVGLPRASSWLASSGEISSVTALTRRRLSSKRPAPNVTLK
jgi:hypothetical protein